MKFCFPLLLVVILFGCQPNNDSSNGTKGDDMNPADSKDISMFPAPARGMAQYIIDIPNAKRDDPRRLEIYAGKEMLVDCNQHSLQGSFKEHLLSGWGYTYLTFETNGQMISTRKACPGADMNRFVSSQGIMWSHNITFPIVIYVPKEYTVKYHVWRADKGDHPAVLHATAPAIGPASHQIQLNLEATEPIDIKNTTGTLQVFGNDPRLADHSATLIASKSFQVDHLPATIHVPIPKDAANMIKPAMNNPADANFYVTITWNNNMENGEKESGDIMIDFDRKFPNINLSEDAQTIYLKQIP